MVVRLRKENETMSEKSDFELVPDQPAKQQPRRRKNMDDYADWDDKPQPKKSNDAVVLVVGLVIFVLLGLVVFGGIVAFVGLRPSKRKARPTKQRGSRPPDAKRGKLGTFTIDGPDGPIQFPPAEVTVVNVFLQACPDCMPSFNVYRDCGGFEEDAPVVNIAYNSATKNWLKDYNMDKQLVFDRGGRFVVNPQGIRKFTTLVVDREGIVQLRIQPTERDYPKRVRAKVQELQNQ